MKRFLIFVAVLSLAVACTSSDFSNKSGRAPMGDEKLVKEISIDFIGDDIKKNYAYNFTYNEDGKATYITESEENYMGENEEYIIGNHSWTIEYLNDNKLYVNEKVNFGENTSDPIEWENPFVIELNHKGVIESWNYINYSDADNVYRDSFEYSYDTYNHLTSSTYQSVSTNSSNTWPTSYVWNNGNMIKYTTTFIDNDPPTICEAIYNNVATSKINIDLYPFITSVVGPLPYSRLSNYTLPLDNYCTISSYLFGAGYIGKRNANYMTQLIEYRSHSLTKPDPFTGLVCNFQWVFDEDNCPTKCIVTVEDHYSVSGSYPVSDTYQYAVDITYVE